MIELEKLNHVSMGLHYYSLKQVAAYTKVTKVKVKAKKLNHVLMGLLMFTVVTDSGKNCTMQGRVSFSNCQVRAVRAGRRVELVSTQWSWIQWNGTGLNSYKHLRGPHCSNIQWLNWINYENGLPKYFQMRVEGAEVTDFEQYRNYTGGKERENGGRNKYLKNVHTQTHTRARTYTHTHTLKQNNNKKRGGG